MPNNAHRNRLLRHHAGAAVLDWDVDQESPGMDDVARIERLEAELSTVNMAKIFMVLSFLVASGAFVFAGVNYHRLNNTNNAVDAINNGTTIASIINLGWLLANRIESKCGVDITFQNLTNALSFGLALESTDESISFGTCGAGDPLDMLVTNPANNLEFTSSDSSINITGGYPAYDFVVGGV
jgi:hypothetical protein